jgi:arsenite-transporting ATPase
VVLNRLLPTGAVEGDFMQRLSQMQAEYRQQVHDLFAPLPVWEAPHYPYDVTGVERLAELGRDLFKEADPTQIFFRGSTQEIIREGDEFLLKLPLPHVEIGKVGITKRGDELFITIGNFKRDMILPMTLAERPAKRALFRNGVLEVRFGPPDVPQPA